MSERQIDLVPLSAVKPHPQNPKNHQIPLIIDSVARFGFVNPLVVDDRTGLLAVGHGRLEALQTMKAAGRDVPAGIVVRDGDWLVPVSRGWSSADDAELLAYVVADNRSTELGGWHDDGMAAVLKLIAETPLGFDGVGFDDLDLVSFLAKTQGKPETHTDPDAVPEPPKTPITKRGDLWILGGHTTCPDCGHQNPVGASAD